MHNIISIIVDTIDSGFGLGVVFVLTTGNLLWFSFNGLNLILSFFLKKRERMKLNLNS
jgi:hypothetical protein